MEASCATHATFKGWPNINQSTHELTSDEWEDIMTENASHPYDTHPLTYPVTPLDLSGLAPDDNVTDNGRDLPYDLPDEQPHLILHQIKKHCEFPNM
jgi:hypothetical protein